MNKTEKKLLVHFKLQECPTDAWQAANALQIDFTKCQFGIEYLEKQEFIRQQGINAPPEYITFPDRSLRRFVITDLGTKRAEINDIMWWLKKDDNFKWVFGYLFGFGCGYLLWLITHKCR
jgi:hypothetical protein